MNSIDKSFFRVGGYKVSGFRLALMLALALILSSPLFGIVTRAQATTTTTREEIPVNATTQGCDEMIVFSGIAKIVTHSTVDADGGIHMSRHLIFRDVTGIGVDTNARYRIVNSTQFNSYSGGPFPIVVTGPFNLRVIGPGPGNNLVLSGFDRVTVNANGTVTSFVEHFRSECH